MFIFYLLLMERHLLSDTVHEWLGILLFILFIAHNLLNYQWYRMLFKGKYTVARWVQTIVNFLLCFAMLGCMISGILSSVSIFPALGGMANSYAARLHWLTSAWAFVLMSVHFGLHWSLFVGITKRLSLPDRIKKLVKWFLRVLVMLLCIYGLYLFMERRFWEELFLIMDEYGKELDYTTPAGIYFIQTGIVSILIMSCIYYLKKLGVIFRKKKKMNKSRYENEKV